MKKFAVVLLFLASPSFAMRGSGGGGGSNSSSTDIYPATNTASFPYGVAASTLTTTGLWVSSGYNCSGNTNSGKLTVDASGNVVCANDISGAGGGGGTTIWVENNQAILNSAVSTISINGVLQSTTIAGGRVGVFLNYDTNQFTNSASTFSALASSFTLQSNAFNAANKLLQLDGSALVPAAQIPTTLTTYIQNTNTLQSGATAYPSFVYAGSSAAISGPLSMQSNLINNVTDPSANQDAATKNYVDSKVNGIDYKAACLLGTTAALPANTYNNGSSGVGAFLTGVAFGALSIDGSVVVVGQRILVKNEAVQSHNGLYTVTTVGAVATLYVLTRTTDFNSTTDIEAGDAVYVTSGTVNSDTGWVMVTSGTITVGTSPIVFNQFTGPGTYSATAPVTLNSTTFGLMAVSLSTGVTGSLPAASIAGGNLGPTVIVASVVVSGVTAASYGTATQVPGFTVGVDGRITIAANTLITPAAASITGGVLGPTVIASSLAIVGVSGTYGSASISPTITFNAQGQVTSASSNTIVDTNNFNNYVATNPLSMGSKGISNIGASSSAFNSGGGLVLNSSFTIAGGVSITGVSQVSDYIISSTDTVVLSSSAANITRYNTLPALTATSSQTVTIVKVDLSSNPVVVRTKSATDLIAGTTTQLWMYAPGQSISLIADKNTGSWWTTGRAPVTAPVIGIAGNDPNSAAALTSSTTFCHAEYVPDFTVMTGMTFNVATPSASNNVQIAAYDNYGVLIGTSAYTTMPGSGIVTKNFINPVYLSPGTVWLCFGSNAAIMTISRRSTGANDMGTCSFATSLPFAATKTFPLCTHTGNDFAFFGNVGGGIVP